MRSEKLFKGVWCRVNLHPRISVSTSSLYFDCSFCVELVGREPLDQSLLVIGQSCGTMEQVRLVSLFLAPLGEVTKKYQNIPFVYLQIQRFIDWLIYFDHLYLIVQGFGLSGTLSDFTALRFWKTPKNIYILRTICLLKGMYTTWNIQMKWCNMRCYLVLQWLYTAGIW